MRYHFRSSLSIVLAATTVLLLVSLWNQAAAQQGNPPAPKTGKTATKKTDSPAGASAKRGSGTVTLGTVTGETGAPASVPLYYTPDQNSPPLRSLHVEVEFVSKTVKFVKAEKGASAEKQNYELAVAAKELPPDDKKIERTRLLIDISVADSGGKNFLPDGLLAFLNFQVPADAKFSISLNPVAFAAKDASEKPVTIAAEAGKIVIATDLPTMIGCFFFSH